MHLRLLAPALLALSLTAAHAQDDSYPPTNGLGMPIGGTQEQAPQKSSITVKARIVVLDVVVTDKKGNLIQKDDLKPEDFEVYEDGVLQKIRNFEPPSKHLMPTLDRPIVNSAADLKKIGDAPVTILVLDELNSQFQDMSYARNMLVKYLQSQPAILRQPTALMLASNTKFEQVHDYTQDRDALIEVVKKHMPEYPWKAENGGNSGAAAVERMAQNLSALQQLARSSTGTPGRKNVIWVGNGFPSANLVGLPQDEADTIEKAFRQVTARLLAARITVYTINPMAGTTVTVEADDPADLDSTGFDAGADPFGEGSVSFQGFARETGGVAYMGRNDLNNVIAEGIDKGRDYYTLAYSPTNKSDDAVKYRNIRVVMKDKNLRATTRNGYFPETDSDLNPTLDKTARPKDVRANLQMDLSAALTSTISYNGLDVTVKKSSSTEFLLTVAEQGIAWSDPGANGEQHAEATVAAGWYDAKGKLIGHVASEQLSPRKGNNDGATYKVTATIPSNAVRIRFVVRDALNAHMGTADLKP